MTQFLPDLGITTIIWREAFEAVLIVTIVSSWLKKNFADHIEASSMIKKGVGLGIIFSVLLGVALFLIQENLSGEALDHFQTGMLLLCGVLMLQMCIWMQRHGRHYKKELEGALQKGRLSASKTVIITVICFAVLREGFETVVYLFGMVSAFEDISPAASAVKIAGSIVLGGGLTWASSVALKKSLSWFSPQLFFKITGIFLILTAGNMIIKVSTRLIQADVIPSLKNPVWDSSFLLDDTNSVGSFMSAFMGYQSQPALMTVIIYALFWLTYFFFTMRPIATQANPSKLPLEA